MSSSGQEEKVSFRESLISQKELNECDRFDFRRMGRIQGQTAHVIFIQYPEKTITAVDAQVFDVSFIKNQENNSSSDEEQTRAANELLGTSIEQWVPPNIVQRILSTIQEMVDQVTMRGFSFFSYEGNFYAMSVSTNEKDHSVIGIEFEQMDDDTASASLHSALEFLRQVMDFRQGGAEMAVKVACEIMFKLLGCYDRAMVYRFSDDLSGHVIHEVQKKELKTSYLGLRFPASDIPQSSRMLYVKNMLRYIRDCGQEDVPILSQEDTVDLTQIRSRSVHKAHLIYMKNMGIVSSMSIAIVVDGELWGLLGFHGVDKPVMPSLHQRVACETIGTMVSTRVEALIRKEQSSRIVRFGELMMKWNQVSPVKKNLELLGERILALLEAEVLVGRVQDVKTHTIDEVVKGDRSLIPGEGFWEKIVEKVPNRQLCVVSTRANMDNLGITEEDSPAAGFLYFHEGQTQMMIGRAWLTRDVKWGGRPDATKERVGDTLTPRKSFATFLQKAKTESKAWNPFDQTIGELFRDRVCVEQSHSWMLALLKNDVDEANVRYFGALERSEDNSDFFASLAHELRTPFHAVISSLNMLHDSLEELSPDEITDLVKTSLTSGNHMMALLNDILSRSKNKYLATSNSRDMVILRKLALDIVKSMKSLASSVSLKIDVEVSPKEDFCVVVDRTKVTQILTNVINNAIKFAGQKGRVSTKFSLVENIKEAIVLWEEEAGKHDGSLCVLREEGMLKSVDAVKKRLASVKTTGSQHYVCASVTDTGPGMEIAEMVKVFEPYTQLDRSVNYTQAHGTGLGLYICASLIRQLDGFIACSSTPFVGTTFFIGIPVEVMGLNEVSPDSQSGKGKGAPITIHGPILLVDDSQVNLKILSRQLALEFKKRGMNIEVMTARGGREAIDSFRKRLPSVLIVDYHMPEMDGIETMTAIRDIETKQGLPRSFILSYTADVSEKAHGLLLEGGADEIMSKPPPKDFISNLVDRFSINTSSTAASLCKV